MFGLLAGIRPYLYLAAVIGIIAAIGGAYIKGRYDQSLNCQEERLKGRILSLERDLQAQKTADLLEAQELLRLKEEQEALEQEIIDYEEELKARPDADICRLNDADIERLRGKDSAP